MEIVNFSEKTFGEIPKQDNPAYVAEEECILICKQDYAKPPYKNCGRIAVLLISVVEFPEEQETVSHLGLFWEIEHALLFANAVINSIE